MLVASIILFGSICSISHGQNAVESYFIKRYITSKMNRVLDHVDTNSTCMVQSLHVADAARNQQMWALRMIDASSKISSGMLAGNIFNFGSYDECLATDEHYNGSHIKGKYCLFGMSISNLPEEARQMLAKNKFVKRNALFKNGTAVPLLGAVCIPTTCNAKDLKDVVNASTFLNIPNITLSFEDTYCQTVDDRDPMTFIDYFAILFLLGTLCLIIASTAYEVVLSHTGLKPFHEILLAFSVNRNFKKLITVKQHPDQIPCINGLRFISMMWIILGHRYFGAGVFPNINYLYVVQKWPYLTTSSMVTGATVSVDTFFFISGVLVIYIVLLAKSQGIDFNVFHYYIHRYIRLTPALAAVILIYVSIFRFFGSGPLWPIGHSFYANGCEKYWWKSLLYIQNFSNAKDMCVGQTWYLGIDTQLYFLAPLIFLPLRRWPAPTIFVMIILALISCYLGFWISWTEHANASLFSSFDFFNSLYTSTLVRMNTWLIGAVLGYALFKTRGKIIKINTSLVIFMWVLSMFAMSTIVFSMTLFFRSEYDRFLSAIYYGFSRAIWTLGLAWIVFACVHGYGGVVNKILSCRLFVVLGRLTYSMFLLHMGILIIIMGSGKTNGYFSDMNNMHAFWGDLAFVVVASTIWSLAFESPVIAVGKLLIPDAMAKKIKQAGSNGTTATHF